MMLLFIGAAPEVGAPGDLPPDLPAIAIDTLPQADTAQQTVFAARLRANPVSTFVAQPSETHAQFEQLFLMTEVDLRAGEGGYRFGLNDESLPLGDFASRVSAVVDAFNPKHRRIGFIRVTDTVDEFPMAIADVQTALNSIGFDMMVVKIGADAQTAACADIPAQALHLSVVNGLADRAPFGDGDGISTAAEVESYLTGALNRLVTRDPVCGPKYSLLIKSSNDPSQQLVAYSGRSAFSEMETGLYNETFEAMFLLESDDHEGVQNFLASCLYCPNEKALTDHLRDMEDYARTDALETEIWDRIKGDSSSQRLEIYLENCALCSYREAARARIEEIEARVRAYDAEVETFNAVSAARDVAGLRSYVQDCIACAFGENAAALIAEIENDTAYQEEQALLRAAIDSQNTARMRAYLDSCRICDGKDAIAEALVIEQERAEISAPCLALAGVPQLGGPRKLDAIDQATATRACRAAAAEFPDDGLIRTTQGRIAQAGGDFDAANAAYAYGMEQNTPTAFGLAAYAHYAPPDGGNIDLGAAEALAREGADKGDWLSQEILTVLYSKDLIPGKTPADAFGIAENMATQGNALAQFFVGYYYLTGTGIGQDDDQAAEWLGKSVDQGYTHAYSFLAELHEKGADGDALPDKAADLYWTALELGDPTATDRLTTQLGSRNREVVRIIQQKLRDLEVYRGSVDGIAGPGTVAAIQQYSNSLNEQG